MAAKSTGSGLNVKDLTFFALFSLTFGSMMGSGVFDIPQNIALVYSSRRYDCVGLVIRVY